MPEDRDMQQEMHEMMRYRPPGGKKRFVMICDNPNCRYTGPVEEDPNLLFKVVVLALIFFPAAIFYICWKGNRCNCPQCGKSGTMVEEK